MAHFPHTKTWSFERVLNSHPLVRLVGIAVTAGGVVFAVMNYLTTERITNLNIEHKAEVAEIKTTDKAELLTITTPLNQKIEDFNFRLTSIERRLPGAGPSYLDITTVTRGPEIRHSLSSARYASYDNEGFYVAVPPGTWKFEMTDELSQLKSIYISESKKFDLPQLKPLSQVLAKSPVFLWQGSATAQIFADFSGEEHEFLFRPSILVRHITIESLKEIIDAGIEYKTDLEQRVENLQQSLAEFRTNFNEFLGEAAKNSQNAEDLKALELVKREFAKSDLSSKRPTTRQQKVRILEYLASSELTDYVLFIELGHLSSQSQTWPLKNHILSIQHKGNVFYIQDRIKFTNVETSINDGERHHVDGISVEQEIFFFSKGKDGYIVTTLLPPVPDLAENFAWSASWLTGLQIPID